MARIAAVRPNTLSEDTQAILKAGEAFMGFMPNDALVMAHLPGMLPAFLKLVEAIYGSGTLDPGFKRLIGMIASSAAGCSYCEAHTAFAAHRTEVDEDKIAAIWDYETSPLFDDAERCALRVAQRAALVPNAVEDHHFEALADHFTEAQQTEIVAVIALFGFLNRWNSTLQTELEALPAALREKLSQASDHEEIR
ncbi:MAG: carboxymuconolactone decarboxylase family protein [Sphingomonadales bacterium]